MVDAVDRLYLRSVLEEDTPPAPPAPGAGPLIAGAAPLGPFALHGTILTPDTLMSSGFVVVDGGVIADIRTTKPSGLPVIKTEGVILPGLIDLHGHPEFNIFAAWEPPRQFRNRGQWRRSDEYAAIVREPMNQLTDQPPSLARTLLRYAEARALTGGATAIQGVNGSISSIEESLVRNVDRFIFGAHRARSIVDLDRETPARKATLRAGQIANGAVDALYVHLAEGIDDTSRKEFDQLVSDDLLTPATVIIHGTHGIDDGPVGRRRGRRGEARVVAAEQPAPVRRHDAGGGGEGPWDPGRARGGLAAEREPEPARRDEGRAPGARGPGPPGDGAAAGPDGHARRCADRGTRGVARAACRGSAGRRARAGAPP